MYPETCPKSAAIREKVPLHRDPMALPGKVILLGDSGVGKTSLVQCYQKAFTDDFSPTIGARSQNLTVDGVVLNIWDTAGQEEYRSLVPVYLRGAQVALVVFDLSRPETFDHLADWLLMLDDVDSCHIIIVGNKSDLRPHEVAAETVGAFVAAHGGLEYFSVSAKLQDGVDVLFISIADFVKADESDTSKMNVHATVPPPVIIEAEPTKTSCC
jgi:small GTP-binding protein